MALFSRNRHSDATSPESSPGGPVFDAKIDPADAAQEAVSNGRLQQARDIHLWYDKSAAARVYSNTYESTPSPTIVAMMNLGAQRDRIEWQTSRRAAFPYPGVELGHVPSIAPAPYTGPVIGNPAHHGHHNHQVESKRATRARFGS